MASASPSVRKDSVVVVGIHPIPARIPEKEFEVQFRQYADALLALPAVKDVLDLKIVRGVLSMAVHLSNDSSMARSCKIRGSTMPSMHLTSNPARNMFARWQSSR